MTKPNEDIQNRLVRHIKDSFSTYQTLTSSRRNTLVDVYKAYTTFRQTKQSNWSSNYYVNKAHPIVEKVLPRLIAKNPKWIVTARNERADMFPDKEKAGLYAEMAQDYLTYLWDEYNYIEPVRLWAKQMIYSGKGYAKVGYKYEMIRTTEKEEIDLGEDEYGEPVKSSKEKIIEKVAGEHPTIDVKSWTEVYYDPRYVQLCDRPGFVEIKEGVRLSDLLRKKKDYFNLDLVKKIGDISAESSSMTNYKKQVQALLGIGEVNKRISLDGLTLKIYYGFFNESETDPTKEKFYKICTVDDMIVIAYEEITQNPFVEIKCFEDPETAFAIGFVEPIMGLQDELNYKKNAASEYINRNLYRQRIWSDASGIDPRAFNDPIIPTTADGQTALANFVDLPHSQIDPAYFQEQNDIERQIQVSTHTVDVSNAKSQQSLTNTATGARIQFFESNSVIDEVRKHLEKGLEELAYKMLQCVYENMDDNIVFKKMGSEKTWKVNKEAFKEALLRYSIRVEVNSSAFDYIENRRDESKAKYETLVAAKQAGEPVETTEALKDWLSTYEHVDPNKYVQKPQVQSLVQGMGLGMAQQGMPPQGMPQGAPQQNMAATLKKLKGGSPVPVEASRLTEQVAGGGGIINPRLQ